ncbi:MAG: biotin--[acetyl-CoA-carboxylase] ligase [Dehalococcoidia bacterium]|nr:biotin--[acetyl-CoA-carboxylase] ligase [Dehalococcoidia bacterium]
MVLLRKSRSMCYSIFMTGERITASAIMDGLNTRVIGRRLLIFDSISSTMDVARKEALEKAPEGTAVIAERQTAGRGRLNRAWLTPEGNIAVSIVLYPPRECRDALIMLASLAVLNAIQSVTGLACQLKWPNDVLIHGKKVCGVLIETKMRADRLDYAILGIGINVNMRLAEHAEIQAIATSLADELGKTVSRVTMLRSLFTELERLYIGLFSGKSLYDEWRRNLATIGRPVTVHSGDDVSHGTAESVSEDGSLLLRCEDGSLRRITIGDVSLREQTKENG